VKVNLQFKKKFISRTYNFFSKLILVFKLIKCVDGNLSCPTYRVNGYCGQAYTINGVSLDNVCAFSCGSCTSNDAYFLT